MGKLYQKAALPIASPIFLTLDLRSGARPHARHTTDAVRDATWHAATALCGEAGTKAVGPIVRRHDREGERGGGEVEGVGEGEKWRGSGEEETEIKSE
eukprot:CAMPEP_0114521146 /NCGR_PEP_ID=MMETSP0109-20121206/20019_1 /TAXON_ID=29199 /ORGANISM="Chlorarachnion reptans, Strain CCCM449" /LENGTH=97 /DNA_ID=CAMNT_0001702209 /DNA_START=581 /DNA_END=872 /DNA_ORIENTATION=-